MELKNIYLLHHSHLDCGFTHSQVVINELQTDFLDHALSLLDATEDWDENSKPRWTIEVHEQLRLWLASATPAKIRKLTHYVKTGRIGMGAIRYNTTPLSSVESLHRLLVDVPGYRKQAGFPVTVAFQCDVNGLPWVMSDLLLDAGVELFVMAVNLHTGGNGPVRPGLFRWRTPRGRTLRVWSGHDYAAFDIITEPWKHSPETMKTRMDAHWEMLQEKGYPYEFLYLTSTNLPVAYDNGGPSLLTAEKVREWNRQPGFPPVCYVSPEELNQQLKTIPDRDIPEFTGDWNDFWNYGAGSTAREVVLNARTKQKLFSSALLGTQRPHQPRLSKLHQQAWEQVQLFEEHTWGYWAHAMHPDHPQVISTEIHKRGIAHDGHEMARYVQGARLAEAAGNPSMYTSEGLLVVNPSPIKKAVTLDIPSTWRKHLLGHLSGFSYHHSEPLKPVVQNSFWGQSSGDLIRIEMEPFSTRRIPWENCEAALETDAVKHGSMENLVRIQVLDGHEEECRKTGNQFLESPFHYLEFDPKNGRIIRFLDRKTGWEVLPPDADYNLLEPVHEKPDARLDGSRKSYYDRDVEKEIRFQDCWNEMWTASRSGIGEVLNVRVERGPRTACLIREYRMEGASNIQQRFELSADHPWMEVEIILHKDFVRSPESIYFVSQLNLDADWSSVYDGSGVPVTLDEENMPGTNRSWITQEAFTRMEDGNNQFSVFAPEMPLVQIGGFHFGKPLASIPRNTHPLLLNWACNNYWETNFPTTQEGVIRFNLGIYTSRKESNADIYRMADGFARKPLFLPVAACTSEASALLVQMDNPKLRLVSVVDAQHHAGMIYRFSNPGMCPETCEIDFVRELTRVSRVSPTEELLEPCPLHANHVRISVAPREIVSLLIRFSEETP
jgi:hypothetical protein